MFYKPIRLCDCVAKRMGFVLHLNGLESRLGGNLARKSVNKMTPALFVENGQLNQVGAMKTCLQLGGQTSVHLPLCSSPCIRLAFPFLSLWEERLEDNFRLSAGWATIENK